MMLRAVVGGAGLGAVRKGIGLGGIALIAGVVGPSAAWAQCTNSLPVVIPGVTIGGMPVTATGFLPLGQGGAVNSLVSVLSTINTAFLTNTSAFVSAPGNPAPNQQGSGAWARGVGGSVDTENSSKTTVSALGAGVPGSLDCETKTRTEFSGYQVGHDISILNGGATGANLHVGITAGYLEADATDKTPGFGTFSGNFQVPFFGVYGAFTRGGFFMDAQARFDFYKNNLTDVSNGLFGQDFNARGISLTGNVGYNMQLGGGWFLEPSAGLTWSRVEVDELRVSGTLLLQNNPGLALPGTVQIEDIESVLGRASLRVGTNFTSGGVAWQPFFTASVFNEFAGDVTTRLSACALTVFCVGGAAPDLVGTLVTSRIGTYGQLGLGTAAAIINTGWLGYARVDYKIGEDIEGWAVNAGLRYQFTPEQRASVKDAPVATGGTYNWTGVYVGGSAGMTWAREPWQFTNAAGTPIPGGFVDTDASGYLVGGQTGFNLQMGQFVVGIEGDYDWTNARGGKGCPNPLNFFTCGSEINQLASVTGRVGYAWGRALFYGKAGWAGGEISPHGAQNTGGNPLIGGITLVEPINNSKWANGYTYGAGMEFALTNYVSAKAEWMHYDLGTENFQVSSGPEFADLRADGNIVRIGINVHLNPMRREAPLK